MANGKNTHTLSAIFLVRLFYTKLLNILEVYFASGIMPRNTTLNHYYTSLLIQVEQQLKDPGLKSLKKDYPKLYDSIIGDLASMDESWEAVKNDAYEFLGKVEKVYISLGSPTFELPEKIASFLKNTDLAVQAHVEYCKQIFPEKIKKTNLPKIFFDKNTGTGFVNRKKFTCRVKNRLFNFICLLYEKAGQTIPRSEVLKSLKLPTPEDSLRIKPNNYKINDLAKAIRKIMRVNSKVLINNSGNLTLEGIKLTSPPN